jgi:outer membrane protein
MKSASLLFNVILLALVGILFYLHFSSAKTIPVQKISNNAQHSVSSTECKIAYYEMDSIENSFSMVKDVKAELAKKEDAVNGELARLEKMYREKTNEYQGKAASMNQVQSEMATKDIMQMQQTMQSRKQALDQQYQDFYMRRMRDVKTKIEDYLKTYNAGKEYAYIFAYEPGLFYYRDTAYNITADVIKGLNEAYTKK